MRNVILSMMETLDGFTVGRNEEMDWITFDDEIWEYIIDFLNSVDAAFLGREAYQAFDKYWPAVAKNKSSPKHEKYFAHWIEKTPKTVFSKTLEKVEYKNSRLVRENIGEEVQMLKKQPGKDIVLFGGANIASTFMRLGLIDEYRIIVAPILIGDGKLLFKNIKDRLKLKLLRTKTFTNGVILLCYQLAGI